MEQVAGSSPLPRSSPTKRSFDVAFLTGARDDPPLLSQSPELSPNSSPQISDPVSPSSTASVYQPCSTPDESRVPHHSNIIASSPPKIPKTGISLSSPHESEATPSSAFKKVTRTTESLSSKVPPISHGFSSNSWPTSTDSLSAVTSFLSGNKSLAPLLASSGIFPSSLSPLLPPDRINNNLVEEYLKSQQNSISSKAALENQLSTAEALSRLRSSMYSTDPYKMHFGSMSYPAASQTATPPAPKINTVPFIAQNPVAVMIPSALSTINLASQNVCAKCNLSFRMTSDLVYHMRSQHKREEDPYKKRRNDRLKCTICGESFRERHHLTRHMTAHQDRKDEEAK